MIARRHYIIYKNPEPNWLLLLFRLTTYVKVHSRAVKVVMYFQLSPHCDNEEEFESFPEDQKFFVGTDSVTGKYFHYCHKHLCHEPSLKIKKKNKAV